MFQCLLLPPVHCYADLVSPSSSRYLAWFGLFTRRSSFASLTVNHFLNLILSAHSPSGCNLSTYITKTLVLCPLSVFSNTPRHLPSFPMTPASSLASLTADPAWLSTSLGSTFPPGMIQPLPPRDDTKSTSSSSLVLGCCQCVIPTRIFVSTSCITSSQGS